MTRSVLLPLAEIELRFSRSSGPGGQHANTAETRVEAILDVEASTALTDVQKRRVVTKAGPTLRAVAQDERSQLRNRELAVERLAEQLRQALKVPAPPGRDEADEGVPRAAAGVEEAPLGDEAAPPAPVRLGREVSETSLTPAPLLDSTGMDVLRLATLLEELPTERTRLLDNLGRLRREVGPITPELSDALADRMNLRRGDVHEVVSFYSFLQVPVDAVRVCTGPICDAAGGRELLSDASVEVPCLGHCDLAPVVLHGDDVLGGVTHSTNGFLLEPDDVRTPPLLTQAEVLERLEASGLTGMGGAGFPAWRKWDAVRREPAPRVVIVNADEGEPGTIKDRYVMELRPQLLLEGLEAAMRFCETDEAYIYLREEYATSRAVLQEAIAARGLPVQLVIGAGAYICGEETALLESMEGRRGMPRLRPPFPAQSGYLGRPTLINNVETLAHVALILRGGWQPVRLWSVSGAVAKPGCYEAPLDVTLRELIDALRGRADGRAGRDRPRRRRERDPAAGRARHTADARGARRMGLRRRLGRRPGLPRRRTRRGGCSPRRCASSPRSRARSARRAGSATARSTRCSRASGR